MLRIFIPLAFLAAAASSVSEPLPDAALRQAIENGLRPKIDVAGEPSTHWNVYERMRRYGVPTMTVAMIRHGTIAWSATYRSDGTVSMPATRERYQAASLSKGVAGSLAALLADKRQIDLDAPVDACLAPLQLPPGKQDEAHPVTLRNLLHHTAGATVNGFSGYPAGAPVPSPEQVVLGEPPANSPAVAIATTPGTAYAYSGGGYTVAQVALTHCTKKPFRDLMQAYVLGPAGMRDSSFAQPMPATIAHATGHLANGEAVRGGANTYPELAAAGLWTTASDLARWLIGVRDAYRGETSFLSKAAAEDMLSQGMNHYGLGVFVAGDGTARHFMHEGGNTGFKSKYVMYLDSGDGVVMLTDSDSGRWLNVEFTKAVADALGWDDFAPRIVTREPLDVATMEKRVGTYLIADEIGDGSRHVALGHDGSAWYLTMPDTGKTPLVPTGEHALVSPELGYEVTFDDSGGLIVGTLRATRL